jgi:hypothetical protein
MIMTIRTQPFLFIKFFTISAFRHTSSDRWQVKIWRLILSTVNLTLLVLQQLPSIRKSDILLKLFIVNFFKIQSRNRDCILTTVLNQVFTTAQIDYNNYLLRSTLYAVASKPPVARKPITSIDIFNV